MSPCLSETTVYEDCGCSTHKFHCPNNCHNRKTPLGCRQGMNYLYGETCESCKNKKKQ